MRPPLSSDPRPWNPTWDGMIAYGGLFLEKLDPPPRETIASRIHDFIIYLGIARNKVSKWERIEKITDRNCPNKHALPSRARLAAAQPEEEAPIALNSGSLLVGGCDMQRLPALGGGGWGGRAGLFHIHNQGRHVVRVFDAKGDDGGAGLGHRHLGEERL